MVGCPLRSLFVPFVKSVERKHSGLLTRIGNELSMTFHPSWNSYFQKGHCITYINAFFLGPGRYSPVKIKARLVWWKMSFPRFLTGRRLQQKFYSICRWTKNI